MEKLSVFVPGSIGNVGPGFDVLGLCIGETGDILEAEITDEGVNIVDVTGPSAELVPRAAEKNSASIAARTMLDMLDCKIGLNITIKRKLPLAGGMGASAASAVGGAYLAALASGKNIDLNLVTAAALKGEATVAGYHLDNIAPSVFGGLCIVSSTNPIKITKVAPAKTWWLTLITPGVQVETKSARGLLSELIPTTLWTTQMARTASLVAGFMKGEDDLIRTVLKDDFAEPARKSLIPHFDAIKSSALTQGALGCSISGAGPTVFALSASEDIAREIAGGVPEIFGSDPFRIHVGPVGLTGVQQI